MARIFIGYEVADRDTAAVVMATFPKTAKAGPPRIIRLRDRTGPSLRERVAELEAAEKDAAGRAGASLREIGDRVIAMCDSRLVDMGKRLAALESALGEPVCVGCGGSIGHHHAPDQGGCSGWFPTVREHLARVEVQAFQRDGARSATHARDSAACELDDIATTREMACTTRLFGHDHPEFHDLSHAEWVTELLNAYEMVCHAALFAYGCRGGPGAWRWASDPTGTTLGDVAAWERLLRELAPSGDGGEGGAS